MYFPMVLCCMAQTHEAYHAEGRNAWVGLRLMKMAWRPRLSGLSLRKQRLLACFEGKSFAGSRAHGL